MGTQMKRESDHSDHSILILLQLRSLLAGIPCTALAATTTPAKVAIIVKELGMAGCVQVNVSPHK